MNFVISYNSYTNTAALEAMLNLRPEHICVMMETAINAYSISQTENTKSDDRLGHLKIPGACVQADRYHAIHVQWKMDYPQHMLTHESL